MSLRSMRDFARAAVCASLLLFAGAALAQEKPTSAPSKRAPAKAPPAKKASTKKAPAKKAGACAARHQAADGAHQSLDRTLAEAQHQGLPACYAAVVTAFEGGSGLIGHDEDSGTPNLDHQRIDFLRSGRLMHGTFTPPPNPPADSAPREVRLAYQHSSCQKNNDDFNPSDAAHDYGLDMRWSHDLGLGLTLFPNDHCTKNGQRVRGKQFGNTCYDISDMRTGPAAAIAKLKQGYDMHMSAANTAPNRALMVFAHYGGLSSFPANNPRCTLCARASAALWCMRQHPNGGSASELRLPASRVVRTASYDHSLFPAGHPCTRGCQ